MNRLYGFLARFGGWMPLHVYGMKCAIEFYVKTEFLKGKREPFELQVTPDDYEVVAHLLVFTDGERYMMNTPYGRVLIESTSKE